MQNFDLNAVKKIYNYYIEHTHICFETEPYSDAYMQDWFQQFDNKTRHQACVVTENNQVLGFAYSSKFKQRPAYDTSVEFTVYLDKSATGQGVGKMLTQHLKSEMQNQDVKRAYAVISLPNDASVGLHKKFGFTQVAHLSQVGRKFNKFYDVIWLECGF